MGSRLLARWIATVALCMTACTADEPCEQGPSRVYEESVSAVGTVQARPTGALALSSDTVLLATREIETGTSEE